MAQRPRRKGGSGADQPAARSAPPSSSNVFLIGIAAVVLVGVGVGAAFVIRGNPSEPGGGPAPQASAAPADDPFASVPRAGSDLGGDDPMVFNEKLGEDAFTIAFPRSFQVRVGSVADGKKYSLSNKRDRVDVVWVVGAMKDAVTTADLLREVKVEPNARTGVKPQSQRLGAVVGSGERFNVAQDPDALDGIVLRAPYGADREVVVLGIGPSKARAVVDAMLGSLRSPKVQGIRAVGGVTFLPK